MRGERTEIERGPNCPTPNGGRVCGLDEAGRGALAGPLVVAAVVLPMEFSFHSVAPDVIVRDSKRLSARQRQRVFALIERYSLQTSIEILSVQEIHNSGINWANTEGFRRLIMRHEAEQYIIDGRWRLPELGHKAQRATCVVRADQTIPAAIAAGIVAKVHRDAIMQELHRQHPEYGWDTNTGHGTRQHIAAIKQHSLSAHHRRQFVATALKNSLC